MSEHRLCNSITHMENLEGIFSVFREKSFTFPRGDFSQSCLLTSCLQVFEHPGPRITNCTLLPSPRHIVKTIVLLGKMHNLQLLSPIGLHKSFDVRNNRQNMLNATLGWINPQASICKGGCFIYDIQKCPLHIYHEQCRVVGIELNISWVSPHRN